MSSLNFNKTDFQCNRFQLFSVVRETDKITKCKLALSFVFVFVLSCRPGVLNFFVYVVISSCLEFYFC